MIAAILFALAGDGFVITDRSDHGFVVTCFPKQNKTPTVPASPRLTPPPALADSHPRVGTVHLHSHRCSSCGNVWSHSDASFGNRADHSCPRCWKVEWEVSATPALQVIQKQPAALTNCPNGICPTAIPSRRSRR